VFVKRITLTDVAAHAGVSKATVSMVLNDDARVAVKTRERVQDSLSNLGYIYDRAAASLRKGQTHAVGMIVTQLTNPYFAEFAEGIQAELDAQGMDVLLGVSGEDPERQARLIQSMTGRRVDGVVIIPAQGTTAEALTGIQTPLMMLARRVEGLDRDYVGGDNESGARAAVQHLIAHHGCGQVAFVGGLAENSARRERIRGFLAGAQALGSTVSEDDQPTCSPNRVEARAAARALLEQADGTAPDGVVCFNDVVAFGVLDALAELGLVAGKDVRVIGFDDVQAASSSRPSLASVAVPAHNAGAQAAALLLSRVHGQRTETVELVLPAQLMPRDTCGCPDKGDL